MQVLEPDVWRERERVHAARVEPWVRPRLERRARGQKHPVDDFLFDYYSFRPGQLHAWHPGLGVVLAGDPRVWGARKSDPDYVNVEAGLTPSPARLARHADRLRWSISVLAGTVTRAPRLGCFGLHEWAMVYRLPHDEIRHSAWPLRLSPDAIAEVVDEQGLRCTHFDAFRFYSEAARPLNERPLSRADQPHLEQPGCLHAGMDLYKHAYLFSPFVDSDLVADAFELARDVRVLDMRSSPYDFAGLGLDPVPVETPEGRREFVAGQRSLAERGGALRSQLLNRLEALRMATEGEPTFA
jgi:hypothetical protein